MSARARIATIVALSLLLWGLVASPFAACAQISISNPPTAPATPTYLGHVTNNAQVPVQFNSSFKQMMARTPFFARDKITGPCKIALPNWYISVSSPYEIGTGATASIDAAIEYPAGTITRITFGGANTGTTADKTTLWSDDFTPSVAIPRAAMGWTRIWYRSGGGIPYIGRQSPDQAGQTDFGATTPDKTMSGTITGGNGVYYGPIVFACQTSRPSVLIWGDSKEYGLNERGDASLDYGEVGRSICARYACSKAAIAGGGMTFVSNAQRALRAAIAPYFTHMVDQLGYNDIQGAANASVLSGYQTMFSGLLGQNPSLRIMQATITPGSTSTVAISSLTSSATVATAVIPQRQAAALYVGETIAVAGATPAGYNGTALTVTGVTLGATTGSVTYTLPAGGSGLAAASPAGTMSDLWSSRAFQTPVTMVGDRVALNASIRAGLAQTTNVIDLAEASEDVRDSGVLRSPGWTKDGVHLETFGSQQIKNSAVLDRVEIAW